MELKSITFPGMDDPYLAAPGGYGYGEGLKQIVSADDDTAFTAALSEQFALTINKTRQFFFTKGGNAFIGTLWNAGNNYGVLVANSYADPNVAYRFKQIVRVCNNGTWGAWVDNSPTAFAPSGYGLGKWSLPVTDLNTCTMCGWYTFGSGCANAPFTYGVVEVINRTDTEYVQIAYDTALNRSNHNGAMAKRVKGNSETAWGEWEFVNPPMELGVEYRTTERYKGKPVYAKCISYKASGAIGSNSETVVVGMPHNISGLTEVVRWQGKMDNNNPFVLPYLSSTGNITTVTAFNNVNVTVRIEKTVWTDYTFYFDLYYTK